MKFPSGIANCNCSEEVEDLRIERIETGYLVTVTALTHRGERYHVPADRLLRVMSSMFREEPNEARALQTTARAIVNHVGEAMAEALKERGVDAMLIAAARQATNDENDAYTQGRIASLVVTEQAKSG